MGDRARAWRSILLSLVLAVFALTPVIEGVLCAGDDLAQPQVAGVAGAPALTAELTDVGDHASAKSTCPHGGHCQHAPIAHLRLPTFAVVRHPISSQLRMATFVSPTSYLPEPIDRPPRA